MIIYTWKLCLQAFVSYMYREMIFFDVCQSSDKVWMAAVFPDTYHANILLEEMTIKKIILTYNLLHVFITFLLDLSIDKVFDLKQTGFF